MPATATAEQIETIEAEGWSLTELALRADVNRSTATRWRANAYRTMPLHTAEALCRQAEGIDPPPATVVARHHTQAARIAAGLRRARA